MLGGEDPALLLLLLLLVRITVREGIQIRIPVVLKTTFNAMYGGKMHTRVTPVVILEKFSTVCLL